ncbi:schlafen family member 5-like [Alligator mississippiensis]|uniref:schlafen family member 5-like n=1 Tax=Alligator mississippiensis TaxID=8496 RepID=UPI002877F46F|nr:schlafen family member 5-like [Alligator mississippiensis]
MEVIYGIGNLPIYHFCKAGGKAKYEIKILDVYDASRRKYGYVCAVKIELFCCVVFSCNPDSWIVKARLAKRLRVTEWTDMMVAADPDLSKLAADFMTQLSVSGAPPVAKPIYLKQGLSCLEDLQKRLFAVNSSGITYSPEKLSQELFSEYQDVEDLIKEQRKALETSQRLLIFSRS